MATTTIFSLIPLDLIRAFEAQVTAAYLERARDMLPQLERAVSLALVAARSNYDVEDTVDELVRRVALCGWFDLRFPLALCVGRQARYRARVRSTLEGGFIMNEAKVVADAVAKVEEAVDFFNARVSEKICLVTTSLEGASIRLRIAHEVIQGTVTIGDHSWNVSLKTNYRYGPNAANGVITVYWQVPCLYRGNDAGIAALRAAELVQRQAADAVKEQRQALKAQKAALDTKLYRLADVRMAYESLDHCLKNMAERERRTGHPYVSENLPRYQADVAKACAKAGITDPGSLKAVKALGRATKDEILAIRAQEQALKAQAVVA